LKNGFDPNQKDLRSGYMPLMWLSRMYDEHNRERKLIFKLLVKYGADVTLTDSQGNIFLDFAKEVSSNTFLKFVKKEYTKLTQELGQN
jgi:ankyrin repeat protein